MLVDCSTKPVNGSQLFQQISFAIGVCFYPNSKEQHYLDLDLDNFLGYIYYILQQPLPLDLVHS
jgi:hypothetical protein